jgi:rhodanese-related sulfurtransferase
MITINPFRLATLIDKSEPLDLIDVRTEKEFKSFHVAGARSVPLKKLSAPKVLQDRKRAATDPLYIIGGSRVQASLAAGILTGGGCCHAVVVDGGMDVWMSAGLSVVRKRRFWENLTLLKQYTLIRMNGGMSRIIRRAAERGNAARRLAGLQHRISRIRLRSTILLNSLD